MRFEYFRIQISISLYLDFVVCTNVPFLYRQVLYNYLLSIGCYFTQVLYNMVKLFSRRYIEEVLIFSSRVQLVNFRGQHDKFKNIITACEVISLIQKYSMYRKQIPPTELTIYARSSTTRGVREKFKYVAITMTSIRG